MNYSRAEESSSKRLRGMEIERELCDDDIDIIKPQWQLAKWLSIDNKGISLSGIVDAIPGQLAGVGDGLLQHFLSELVVVLELQGFVVETDGLVELPAEVVDEPQREEGLRVAGVETNALLEVGHRLLVLLQFATGVGQVGQNGFLHPVGAVGMALLQSQLVVPPRLFVVLLLVVYDS